MQMNIKKYSQQKAGNSTYKKDPHKINDRIKTKSKRIMENKTSLNRMLPNDKNSCFITLKDHKPNFLNKQKTPLLNPTKNSTWQNQ